MMMMIMMINDNIQGGSCGSGWCHQSAGLSASVSGVRAVAECAGYDDDSDNDGDDDDDARNGFLVPDQLRPHPSQLPRLTLPL